MENNVKRIFFVEGDYPYPHLPHYELEDGTIMHPVFYYDAYGPTNRMIWLSEAEIEKRQTRENSKLDSWISKLLKF
jgi:hypothetical protein